MGVKSEKMVRTVRTVLLVSKVHKEVLVKMVLLVLSDLKVNLVSGDDLALMANVDKKVNRETKVSKDHPAHLATLETMAHLDLLVNLAQEVFLACLANLVNLEHQRKSTWSISSKPSLPSSMSLNPVENHQTLNWRE